MTVIEAFFKMLPVIFVIALGFFSNKIKIVDEDMTNRLTRLIIYITLPAFIISNILNSENPPGRGEIVDILYISLIIYGVGIPLAFLIARLFVKDEAKRRVWRFALAFTNVGFMGIPVCSALLGEKSAFYASVFIIPFNLLSNSMGPAMIGGLKKFRVNQIFSPALIAAIIALICAWFQVDAPEVVGESLSLIGGVTVPISLIVIGSLLSKSDIKGLFSDGGAWVLSLLRLLILPIGLDLLLKLLGFSGLAVTVAIIQMAMPVATMGTLFSVEYGGDTDFLVKSTFLMTIGSIIAIPVLATYLLG